MKVGRPRLYETPEQMEAGIEAYFSVCEEGEVIPTTAGLAVYLGFSDRHSLYDYKQNELFSHVIKKAIAKIESNHELRLSGSNPAGSIFWLKNHGWSDKQDHELSGPNGGPIQHTGTFDVVLVKPK